MLLLTPNQQCQSTEGRSVYQAESPVEMFRTELLIISMQLHYTLLYLSGDDLPMCDSYGFLLTEEHLLVEVRTVVSAQFCSRKESLAQNDSENIRQWRFAGCDPPRHPLNDALVLSRRPLSLRTRRNQYHAAGALARSHRGSHGNHRPRKHVTSSTNRKCIPYRDAAAGRPGRGAIGNMHKKMA